MTTRYERFNEIIFEAYCKTCITNGILKCRMEKSKLESHEITMDVLPEPSYIDLYTRPTEDMAQTPVVFHVKDYVVVVHDTDLGRAISMLPPRKRDILLLSYFLGMSDSEIADTMGISKSSAQRRRMAALNDLKKQEAILG